MKVQHHSQVVGERKIVTIMFADMQGSVALTTGLDPEQVGDLLGRVVGKMRQAVNRYGGTVTRMSGDGIMAVFGAPLAHEHHAEQACYAGLAVLNEAQEENSDGGPPIRVRIGLHSGEVVMHDLIGDLTTYYEAMGEVVSIAARMEQAAPPGRLVMTLDTRRLAGDAVEVRSLGLKEIKGIPRRMELFELVTLSGDRRHVHRLPWGAGRFVGRDEEIGLLMRALQSAQVNGGRSISIIGEAGAGKSRLIQEFLERCTRDSPVTIVGYAQSFGQRGYQLIISMLEAWFGLSAADSAERVREKVRVGVESVVQAHSDDQRGASMTQALTALCDVTAVDPAWLVLDPSERRTRITDAVCNLFRQASDKASFVLMAEDLHWADNDSIHVLRKLADMVRTRPILLIMTVRDGIRLSNMDDLADSVCRLQPLSRSEAADLLRTYLVQDENSGLLEEALITHTGGNPLFIEECLISLAETGSLERTDFRFRQVRPIEALGLPTTIRALISARVDRLDPVEKEILQAAAVVGQALPRDVLAGITMYDSRIIDQTLRGLCDAEFLVPGASPHEAGVYRHRHALTREAVYQSILLRRRRELHAKVVATMERLHHMRLAEYSEELAEHARQAEDWLREAHYLRQSARKAVARSSNRAAVKFLSDALVATERRPDGPDKASSLVDVLLDLRYPLFKLGELSEVSKVLSRATGMMQGLDDPRRLCLLHAYQSHLSWVGGDSLRALREAGLSVDAAERLDDKGLRVRARFQQGMVLAYRGEYVEGVVALSELLEHITAGFGAGIYPDAGMATIAQCYIARAYAESGDLTRAYCHAKASLELANTIVDPFSQTFAALAMGFVQLSRDDPCSAIVSLEQARQHAIRAETEYLVPLPSGFLGMAYVMAGQGEQAVPLLEDSVACAQRIGFQANQPYRLAALGRAYLSVGRLNDAQRVATDAYRMASAQREVFSEATALCVLSEIARKANPAAAQDVEEYLTRALALARSYQLLLIARYCESAELESATMTRPNTS